MIKTCVPLMILLFAAVMTAAQSDLQKIVDAEHSFARLAAEKGNKTAFLTFLEDGALIFNPGRLDAKTFWTARPESPALLSWAPNYADVNTAGSLGYTTGNWEYRAKGKDDTPVAFGQFITIWRRQLDGSYKWPVDIGIGHAKPAAYSTEWTGSKAKPEQNKTKLTADLAIKGFAQTASSTGSFNAYKKYAASDVRLYREDNAPFLGKSAALAQARKENGTLTLEDPGIVVTNQNLAYFVKSYSLKKADGSVESGNAVQIWKFQSGKWKIVLDVLKPVPAK